MAWIVPVVGPGAALGTLIVAGSVAFRQRRTQVLSGLLMGAGGLWLVLIAVGEIACQQTAACERAAAAPQFVALALSLVAGGTVALRANRGT